VASASAQSTLSRLSYSFGGGPGIGRDDVASFVGNSGQAEFGVGMRLNRLFSVDAEYMYYGLGFRPNVIQQQSLPGQSGHMNSFSLDGIVNVPRHLGKFGAYGIFGVGLYDRSVSLSHSQFLPNGTPWQPAWLWWGLYTVNYGYGPVIQQPGPPGPPYGETMSSNSLIAGGFNYGGGVTYALNHLRNAKFFVEWRYHRAYQSDGKTIVMPVTFGLRW
jgi:hypothetical protein